MPDRPDGPDDLSDDLIVCTRHRPAELRACLETVRAQTRVPAQVTVVDSSEGGDSEVVVTALAREWPADSRLVYLRSGPGVTHQRNVGIDATRHPLVHFVDDDTLLEPGYVEAIVDVFAGDEAGEVGGAGGFITNPPPHAPHRVDEWLGLDSRREGVVLPSGRNVRVYTEPTGDLDVEWLPGAAMSYRRRVLAEFRPDELVGPERNGEDVQLSYRVRQRHRLVVTPRGRLTHLEASWGRREGGALVVVELVSRYERVRDRTGRLRPRAFWVSAWGQLLWYGAKGVVTLSPKRLDVACATARGMLRIRALRTSARGLRRPARDGG